MSEEEYDKTGEKSVENGGEQPAARPRRTSLIYLSVRLYVMYHSLCLLHFPNVRDQ